MGCFLSKELQELEAEEGKSACCLGKVSATTCTHTPPVEVELSTTDVEHLRLSAVHDCQAIDAAKEARFSTITHLLQTIFKVPIVVVGLIESDTLDFHGAIGTEVQRAQRIHSFCDASLKVKNPTMMVVEDTLMDSRFQYGQFVAGPPYVRFYAGAPLVSSKGYVMGSLGMMDIVPRQFPADMYNMLCNFAELVVRELEREKAQELQKLEAAELSQKQQRMVRALSCFNDAIILCDVTSLKLWRILYANSAWESLTGIAFDSSSTMLFSDVILEQQVGQQQWDNAQAAISQRQPFSFRGSLMANPQARVSLKFRPADNDHLSGNIPLIGIPNFVMLDEGGGREAVLYFATAEAHRDGHSSTSSGSSVPSLSTLRTPQDNATSSTGRGSWNTSSGSTIFSRNGDAHACFGLDRPDALEELEMGPLLGKGSYGRVYRGRWRGARVAVKVLDRWMEPTSDEGEVPRRGPMLEALLSKQLPHPHIVQTYEYATKVEQENLGGLSVQGVCTENDFLEDNASEDGAGEGAPPIVRQLQRMWIIQQYCNRGTLYDATDRGWLRTARVLEGPTDLAAVLRTAEEIASALSYLHSRNIIHGDLTGNNVLLSSCTKDLRRFTALVGDFGLARVMSGNEPVATASMGTVTHMPPEALVEGTLTKATDVFSFGVLLWEMYCHRRAWAGQCPSQVVYLVGSHKAQLTLPEGAPPAYKELTERCLASERMERPSFDWIQKRITEMLKEVKTVSPT